MYYINDPDRFEPSARLVLDDKSSLGGRGYIAAKQNPTKGELKNGIYKPRLTLTNRYNDTGKREATLKIEFSIPKLLFGNNFDELTAADFEPVTELLKSKLREMGVMVWSQHLLNAPVSAIHYSKNIPLTNGATPHYLISKMREANVNLAIDVDEANYRNEGYSYKWHTNSYEVAFYDKIKDLQTAKVSGKRAIENDNILQLDLFDDLQNKKRFEVLRIEVRLNKRQKISQVLRSLGIYLDLTYKNLFDPSVSQKVLLQVLHQLESKRLPLFDYKSTTSRALLADIIMGNPNLGVRQKILAFGLKQVFEVVNPRELRAMLGNYSKRSWYKLIADAKAVRLPISQSPFMVIREHLNRFDSLKLVDFKDNLINNDKYN